VTPILAVALLSVIHITALSASPRSLSPCLISSTPLLRRPPEHRRLTRDP
jgi:hypothetical protein